MFQLRFSLIFLTIQLFAIINCLSEVQGFEGQEIGQNVEGLIADKTGGVDSYIQLRARCKFLEILHPSCWLLPSSEWTHEKCCVKVFSPRNDNQQVSEIASPVGNMGEAGAEPGQFPHQVSPRDATLKRDSWNEPWPSYCLLFPSSVLCKNIRKRFSSDEIYEEIASPLRNMDGTSSDQRQVSPQDVTFKHDSWNRPWYCVLFPTASKCQNSRKRSTSNEIQQEIVTPMRIMSRSAPEAGIFPHKVSLRMEDSPQDSTLNRNVKSLPCILWPFSRKCKKSNQNKRSQMNVFQEAIEFPLNNMGGTSQGRMQLSAHDSTLNRASSKHCPCYMWGDKCWPINKKCKVTKASTRNDIQEEIATPLGIMRRSAPELAYQVSLRMQVFPQDETINPAFCGGQIYNNEYIITPAHCLEGISESNQDYVQVIAGAYEGEQQVGVEDIIIHPLFDPNYFDNDIALIKLKTPLSYTEFVQPMPLPPADYTTNESGDESVLGFWDFIINFIKWIQKNVK